MADELAQSKMRFIDCESCRGFGYEVTAAKKHIHCHACKDNPSMYAVFGKELLYWGLRISAEGIHQRWARKQFHLLFNILLLLIGAAGAAALAFAGFKYLTEEGGVTYFFTEQQHLLGYFWISLAVDLFLWYRLDRERASKRDIDYSEEKEQKEWRMPTNPTYEKFRKMPGGVKDDISAYYTADCIKVVEDSYAVARKLKHHVITPLHMLVALLESKSVSIILARLGLTKKQLYKKIGKAMKLEGLEEGSGIDLGLEANRMLFFAYETALKDRRKNVDVTELFAAIITHDPWVSEVFYDLEVDDQTSKNVIEWIHIQKKLRERFTQWRKKASKKPKGVMDRAMTAQPSPLLESMSSDYTTTASRGGFFPMIGRQSEMEQMLRILPERTGNVMLVGPPGAGKSTLLEGLAELMASEEVPPELQDKRFIVLDPGALIADAKGVGTVEGRMQKIILEMRRAGNIILGIEDVHHLLNMRSGSGSEDVSGMLMNAMSQGFIKVVATTTTDEYQEYIENRGPFLRRFQNVQVNELSRDDAILVLEARMGSVEYKHHVFFSYRAIEAAVDLSMQYIQDRYLPAKALDIAQEAAAFVEQSKGEGSAVTKEDIAQIISEKTNVQVTAITADERDKLLNLEEIMHQRMVGQDEAVNAVASALRRAREGLRDENRPIANFLFLGPTGVGKTEMAKTIAEVYFGNEENMIRFDMSEYQSVGSLRKLIGGKGEKGQLTEAIRQKPFALVLLDELEKAHPDVLNVFLQVMDDGRVTDGMGKTFDMSNAMIIATSNAGTQQVQNAFAAGLSQAQIKDFMMDEVLPKLFRPEFINRFDNVVVFKPLSLEDVLQIAERMIMKIAQRLQEEKGITMEVEYEALVELARAGYDPLYGARPLRRVVQDTVDDALAKLLLAEQIRRRDVIILKPGGRMAIKQAVRL